jgi:hypothetical protein
MTEYRVLWVDDEYEEKGGGFIALADDFNIKIDAVKSLDEFKVKLNAGYEEYDGIITDARFFKTANQVTGTENEDAIYELNEFILESIPKKFKLFVYTGQPDLFGGAQFNKMFKDVYEKSKDEERLLKDLIIAADQLPEMQIKKSYPRVFEVFNDHYLPKSSVKDLLRFLDDKIEHDKSSIKMARDFIEDLFRSFAKHAIIPKHFIDREVKLTLTSKFLSGDIVDGYKLNESSLPPNTIRELLYYLVRTTNQSSHRSDIDHHINNLGTDYMYRSVKFALLDVIVWFKLYIDQKPLTNNWSNNWSNNRSENYVKGSVFDIREEIAFFKPEDIRSGNKVIIPPKLFKSNELNEGQIIECVIESYSNKEGKLMKRVKEIKK